jgi:two-component system response regulator AtoC
MDSDFPREIILIDDEPSVLLALKLMLQALGYKVAPYSELEPALNAIKAARANDLVICDLRMPKKNGLKVLEETRTLNPQLPFVLMSAEPQNSEMAAAAAFQVSGFLTKPFTPQELTLLLEQVKTA